MSLWNTVQKLAKDLPEGFIVRIGIENGSAWVELYDTEQCSDINLPDSTDRNLQQQLIDALVEAKKIENADEECPHCGEPYWKCDHIDKEFECR